MKQVLYRFSGPAMLLLGALIWGLSFTAQSVAMDNMGPMTYNAVRSMLAVAFLLPISLLSARRKRKTGVRTERGPLLRGGLLCGVVLFFASGAQQIGISMGTSSGKAGFITALYILLVPVAGLLLRKRVRPIIWPCIGAALVGLFLLCVNEFQVASGDLVVLLCAVLYTVHILLVDKYAGSTDPASLTCVQFAIVTILSAIPALVLEAPTFEAIRRAWLPLVFGGVFSGGIAYTLQVMGQKRTEPTLASLLMSMESVFAVLGAFILLGEWPLPRELVGCGLMFAAIITAQITARPHARES